jgi:ElaB/YqjD/DUF883 family membrane-anchored ribosome-binding protein
MAQATTKPTPEDLAKQMQELRDDVATLTTMLGDLTRAEARDAADSAKRAAHKTRESIEHEYEKLHKQAEDAVNHADALIHERPAMAMGIAAGFGLLVGLMLSRKS